MTQFDADVRRHAYAITRGTLLVIDPASGGTSLPGYACYKAGKLMTSGVLQIEGGAIQGRLRALYENLKLTAPDVLAIERIGGPRAHRHLWWSVGVSIAAANPVTLIEVPVSTWKKHALAGNTWTKGDEQDALAMGACIIDAARKVA